MELVDVADRLYALTPAEFTQARNAEAVTAKSGGDAPREIAVPDDLAAALAADDQARTYFDSLAFTHRKEWVRWIEEAKKPETRTTRVAKTVQSLREGKRTR